MINSALGVKNKSHTSEPKSFKNECSSADNLQFTVVLVQQKERMQIIEELTCSTHMDTVL